MDIPAFIAGFLLATILFAAVTGILYTRLRRRKKHMARIQGYLDLIPGLTDAQRRRVIDIRRTFLPRLQGIRENLCRERLELAHALFEAPPDMRRLQVLGNRVRNCQADLENEVIDHILEEKQILTPAQNQKFHEIIRDQFSWGGLGIHDIRARQ